MASETNSGEVERQDICDEFVREHAVPADDAESWDCEAFHKFRRDRDVEKDALEDAPSALIQTTLKAH